MHRPPLLHVQIAPTPAIRADDKCCAASCRGVATQANMKRGHAETACESNPHHFPTQTQPDQSVAVAIALLFRARVPYIS